MKPSDDIQVKEICKDKNAQTIQEICEVTGLSQTTVRRHAQQMLKTGQWKQVWKKEGNHIVQAYIRVK